MHVRTYLFPTKAVVLLRELCLRVFPPALGAGPEEVLGGEELWGEERVLLHSVPGPLLDALQVEEAVALPAAPRLVCVWGSAWVWAVCGYGGMGCGCVCVGVCVCVCGCVCMCGVCVCVCVCV